jgi:hypothetical protein
MTRVLTKIAVILSAIVIAFGASMVAAQYPGASVYGGGGTPYQPGGYYNQQPAHAPPAYGGQLGPQPGVMAPIGTYPQAQGLRSNIMPSAAGVMPGGVQQAGVSAIATDREADRFRAFGRNNVGRVASRFEQAVVRRSPRWFDIAIDAMHMERDAGTGQAGLSSEGIAGPIVLTTDSGAFSPETGMRFEAAVPLSNSRVIEFTYYGLMSFSANKAVASNGNLFSVLSNFGTAPFGGFGETGQADEHSMTYRSDVDNVELSFRHRWMDPQSRWQGSWIAGVRHVYLTEVFGFSSQSSNGVLDYSSRTANAITGGQIGGDLWFQATTDLSFGAAVKVGAYGNQIKSRSTYFATSINPPVGTDGETNRATFLAEGRIMANWKLNQNLTLRVGYEVLYIDGVALASDQFSSNPPFVQPVPATSLVDNGDVLYTGFSVGFEWMW